SIPPVQSTLPRKPHAMEHPRGITRNRGALVSLRNAVPHRNPSEASREWIAPERRWFTVNPAFRLGTDPPGSSVAHRQCFHSVRAWHVLCFYAVRVAHNTAKEDGVMKRISALAIFFGGALLASGASAAVLSAEDIQAPRSQSEDIQAPRTPNDDIQAPRSS